jgi:hypothetical protein
MRSPWQNATSESADASRKVGKTSARRTYDSVTGAPWRFSILHVHVGAALLDRHDLYGYRSRRPSERLIAEEDCASASLFGTA